MKKLIAVFGLVLVMGSYCSAAVVTPVGYATLTGGQYFLESDPSSFGGNISLYFSPAVNFNEHQALIPVFNIDYRGMRDIRELVGGSALTRQSADYGASLIYVTNIKDYKTRLRAGYKKSLVNETKDEDWGSGLFDYTRLLAGAGAERRFGDWNIRAEADYFMISFDNYDSLVKKAKKDFQTALDTATYSEISSGAGDNVLDYSNAALTLRGQRALGKNTFTDLSWRADLRNYSDQPVIVEDGRFSSDKRVDLINTLSAAAYYRLERVESSLSGDFSLMSSNQNSYDASSAKYIKDFYSYTDIGFTPGISFCLGQQQSRLSLNWSLGWRVYTSRPARDEEGRYSDDEIIKRESSLSVSYLHPITDNISATAGAAHLVSSSNMEYEQSYRYNYTTTNYYAGLSLQF